MLSAEPKYQFNVGDTVKVGYKIQEGDKTRVQNFEGLVIAMKGAGTSRTFTVRRIGVNQTGIERIFPLYSPLIDSVTVVKQGSIRRAKLYYLRERTGKAATRVRSKTTQKTKTAEKSAKA